eukprot:gene8946-895_t
MFVRPRTKATTYEPIRITFDTSYLSSDPGKICLNTGEKIRRGTPATSNIWCGGFTENCYLNCTQFDLVTYANTVPYFQELLAYAKTEVEKVIKVNRLTSSLKANSTTCGNTAKLGVNVPNSMIVTGSTNTDLYIIVTFRPMLSSEKESFSFDCLTDSSSNDRPILGHMNLNPKDFIAVSKETAQRRVLHEVIHLLGFSKNKFLTYKTELGVPRTSVTNTIATSHNGETVQITYLTLPTVMALGKKFFGCSLYQGAQLEDLTGNDDHLEKKIYYNDIMTGDLSTIAGPSAMISPFTLAILADSGYYEVNYDYTSEYTWGQGLGCEFVNNRCEDWAKIKNIDGYFCGTTTGNDNNHCTYDFNSKGVCDAVYYSTAVRNFFQHFTDNRLAGPIGSDIRNLCPLYKTLSSSDCRLTPAPGIVIDYENTGQQYSNISKCFRADLWSKSSFQVRDSKIARCHQYACENGTNLYVKIGQNWINCPSEETLTAIPGFSGALYCPNIRQICPENFTSPHFSTRISDPSLNQNENLWITGVLVFVQKIPSYVWVMWILLAISIIFVLITIAIWRIVHRRVYKKKDEDAVYVEDETREYYEEMERRDMEDLEMELKKKEKQQEIAQQYAGDEDIELKQIDIFEDQNKEVANSEKTTSIPILNLDESTTQNYDENVVKKDNYSDTSDDEDVKKKKKSKTIIIQDGSDNSEEVKKKKKKKKKKHYEEEEDQQEEQNEVVEEDFEEKKMKKKKSKKKFEDNFEDNEEQVEEKKKKKKKKKKHYEEDEEEEIENLEVEEETKKKKKKKKKKHLEEEEEEEESQQQQQENEDDTQEETKKKKKKKKKKYVEEEEEEEE